MKVCAAPSSMVIVNDLLAAPGTPLWQPSTHLASKIGYSAVSQGMPTGVA